MKIHISEKDMPKCCGECQYYRCDGVIEFCVISRLMCSGARPENFCPLKSLEQLKQEVRREFAERLKASVSENSYTVYYNKFSSDNGMTEDGFAELIDNLLKQYELDEYEEKLEVRK